MMINHEKWAGRRTFVLWGGVLAILMGIAGTQLAQEPQLIPKTSSTVVPILPGIARRSQQEIDRFIEQMSVNDAAIKVIVGQGRLITLKEDLVRRGEPIPVVAVGDPSVAEFEVVGTRQIRVIGQRVGVTDLSVITLEGKNYSFEVRVLGDLDLLRVKLAQTFPDAFLKLNQMRDHVIVSGEARNTAQVARILEVVRAYLNSVQTGQERRVRTQRRGRQPEEDAPEETPRDPESPESPARPSRVLPEEEQPDIEATIAQSQIINLIRVPGPQQVLLKVRVAELNRTSMREVGADVLFADSDSGSIIGTQTGGGTVAASGVIGGGGGLFTNRDPARTFFDAAPTTTMFGIFEAADFELLIRALRRNSMLKILAEPNLVAMHGHRASFLAGGEFPVPVPQSAGGGAGQTITVQFKEFGVRLGFEPYIMDDEVIRLTVDPEVSSIDFSIGTVLVPGGSPVPGLNTREAHTTVELRQGQTLAIAGLMNVTLDGQTNRIPGIGDLPVLGPFFSTTQNGRVEKELIILITPYLVEAMNQDEVPPVPGDEVYEPNDLEFYLLSRIEGRTGRDYRSTTKWDDPLHFRQLLKLEQKHVYGECGFSR